MRKTPVCIFVRTVSDDSNQYDARRTRLSALNRHAKYVYGTSYPCFVRDDTFLSGGTAIVQYIYIYVYARVAVLQVTPLR